MLSSGFPAIHPGEFLQEILTDLQLPEASFAAAAGVEPGLLAAVLRGQQPVTAELALRFGRALDQSPHYWLNLQAEYDLKVVSAGLGTRLDQGLLAEQRSADPRH